MAIKRNRKRKRKRKRKSQARTINLECPVGFFSDSSWNTPTGPTPLSLPQCGRCGLYKQCQHPKMKPTGRGHHKILFVAEAPGRQEDERGVQLIGDAGQCLRRILDEIGIDLDDCWKTNAIICRPPNNKMDARYVEACRPNLLRTVATLQPRVIVLLGGSAVSSLISQEWGGNVGELGRWTGWAIPSHMFKAWLCPTYHPSYLLRMNEDKVLMGLTREHLRQAVALLQDEPPLLDQAAMSKSIELITEPRLLRLRLRDLASRTGVVTFDYEATGLKPEAPGQRLLSVAFCHAGRDTFAGTVDASCFKALSAVLLNPKLRKWGTNIKYEERWTRRFLGHGVAGWELDTMLAAHVLDNRRGITSAKFQAYVQLGIGDYSSHLDEFKTSSSANGINRLAEVPARELLTYNGMDALVEYGVGLRQWRVLTKGVDKAAMEKK